MTRDPFSTAACVSDVYSWRRLFGDETLIRAKTIPLGEVPTRSQVPTETRTSRDEVAIASQNAALPGDRNGYPSGQDCTPARYRPATGDAAVALRLLRSVPEPLTTERVARALSWPKYKAKRWLARFAAKGVLVATGKGHAWAR